MDEPSTDSTDLLHPPTFTLPPKFLTNSADVEPNPDETCPATATFLQMIQDMDGLFEESERNQIVNAIDERTAFPRHYDSASPAHL
ncbi:hypothetical protein TrLO_g14764 [Triparma laevis f. longispina]|uniref:Uncharacterized protein n=1 Tax=Triparma laevis f. longispina TaxID=1714387 RepID=A0A9W6ZP83_9STRA|nr:hypothetical protein TrLO_g14764 [Triparma laevis f. longispina]